MSLAVRATVCVGVHGGGCLRRVAFLHDCCPEEKPMAGVSTEQFMQRVVTFIERFEATLP